MRTSRMATFVQTPRKCFGSNVHRVVKHRPRNYDSDVPPKRIIAFKFYGILSYLLLARVSWRLAKHFTMSPMFVIVPVFPTSSTIFDARQCSLLLLHPPPTRNSLSQDDEESFRHAATPTAQLQQEEILRRAPSPRNRYFRKGHGTFAEQHLSSRKADQALPVLFVLLSPRS